MRFCACRIEQECCKQSHLKCAFCACRTKYETWSQCYITCAFCVSRTEYECCSQAHSTCAFSVRADCSADLRQSCLTYAFLYVPNRKRDLRSILLKICVSVSAEYSARLEAILLDMRVFCLSRIRCETTVILKTWITMSLLQTLTILHGIFSICLMMLTKSSTLRNGFSTMWWIDTPPLSRKEWNISL